MKIVRLFFVPPDLNRDNRKIFIFFFFRLKYRNRLTKEPKPLRMESVGTIEIDVKE